jgi:hypothetical protein
VNEAGRVVENRKYMLMGLDSTDESKAQLVYTTSGKVHCGNYVWDSNTLSWVVQTAGTAGTGTSVQVTNFPATQAVTGTFWQATQPVSGAFWQATQPVSAASLPLPTGASTEATLSSLNGKVTACNTGAVVSRGGCGDDWSLTANQSVNNAQVGGSAITTAAAGVQKVGVVGNAGAIFDAATGAAVPANGLLVGVRAATANPANATGGNLVAPMGDKAGRVVIVNGQVRELVSSQQANVAVNTETTVVTAGGAGVFNDLVQIVITTAGAAAQTITIKDGTAGTTKFVLNYPNAAIAPGTPLILHFDPPVPQAAANANWTVTQSLATACNYTCRFVKNT